MVTALTLAERAVGHYAVVRSNASWLAAIDTADAPLLALAARWHWLPQRDGGRRRPCKSSAPGCTVPWTSSTSKPYQRLKADIRHDARVRSGQYILGQSGRAGRKTGRLPDAKHYIQRHGTDIQIAQMALGIGQ